MAHFISYIKGCRGEASRLGSKNSGIRASAQGWNCGMTIYGSHSNLTGNDKFCVNATTGSNGGGNSTWLGSCSKESDGYKMKVNPELLKEVSKKRYIELVDNLIRIMNFIDMPDHEKAVAILISLGYREEVDND